jgi:nucleoside-diphosphate-sugar epimerase
MSLEIIKAMQAAVPPGQMQLSEDERQLLAGLTAELIASHGERGAEHERFLGIRQRGLCLPESEVSGWLGGARVLVTGGTGCIGSALTAELAKFGPAHLASLSRGETRPPWQEGVAYRFCDIRDRQKLALTLNAVRPDVVFHVAAQRDPGLAETEVHRTVSTNVLGTRNVLTACAAAGVTQVVCASTGKALRPYSPDMYTASKRAAEWLGSTAAQAHGMRVVAARFTHVVDNSLVYLRLLMWAQGGVMRLHSPDISFYGQSALEAARLMLAAGVGSKPGLFRVHALRDLGWPVSLLDLALDVLARADSRTPVYFSGYDNGYEKTPFPGLYDPETAGDVSPLINALEAGDVTAGACPLTDVVPLTMLATGPSAMLAALEAVCQRTREPGEVRAAMDALSWSLLDATLAVAPARALTRMTELAAPHAADLPGAHRLVLEKAFQAVSRGQR